MEQNILYHSYGLYWKAMNQASQKSNPTKAMRTRLSQLTSLGAVAVLLAACQSTPLPPWQGASSGSSSNAPAPVSDVQAGVVANAGQTIDSKAFTGYSAAVAARYPEPAAQYQTPGLQPGRTSFSTNQEVRSFLSNLAQTSQPGVQARVETIGVSQDGQEISALLISHSGAADAAGFAASGKPTVLLVGGQSGADHAPTEALLAQAQMLTQGQWAQWLQSINVIIVPLANPDGAARSIATTANGVDLTHDHLTLQTPEARALAKLQSDYRPMVIVDHEEYAVGGPFVEKFNAIAYFDAYIQAGDTPNTPEFVRKAVNEWFVEPVFNALKAQNLSVDWNTQTSADLGDLSLSMAAMTPDTLFNVGGLKNAVSLLVKSRGSDLGRTHIQRRVHTHVVADAKILEQAAARSAHLAQVRTFVNREAASQACRGQVVIHADQSVQNRSVRMLNPASGADLMREVVWHSSINPQITATRTRACGYLLEGHETAAVERLQLLGLSVLRVAEPGELQVQTYTETGPGQVQLDLNRLQVPEGSYYVPMSQPLAQLAASALEPDSDASYFSSRVIGSLNNLIRAAEPPALVFEEVE